MITLHHFEQPGWQRVAWLLEELKVGYEVKRYGRNSAGLAFDGPSAEITSTKANPVNGMPGSNSGAQQPPPQAQPSLMQSPRAWLAPFRQNILRQYPMGQYCGAIVEYLIKQYGRGRFSARAGSAQLDDSFFLHFAEGSFMPPLVLKQVFQTIMEKSPFFVRPFTQIVADQIGGAFIDPVLKNNFALVDLYLKKEGGRTWLAGGKDPTGGDFMMSFPVERAVCSGAVKPEDIPGSMKEYLERVQARPAYKQAFERLREAEAEKLT